MIEIFEHISNLAALVITYHQAGGYFYPNFLQQYLEAFVGRNAE